MRGRGQAFDMKSIKHIELLVSHEQQCIVTIKAGIISQSFCFSPRSSEYNEEINRFERWVLCINLKDIF